MSDYTKNLSAEKLIEFIAYDYVELSHDKVLLQRNEHIKMCREWLQHNHENKLNLEMNLLRSHSICRKVKESKEYAQSLYAALCNVEYISTSGEKWSCSWRYAGDIVARMREEGDYMDWYCSSFGREYDNIREGIVTKEIQEDLEQLGWTVKRYGDLYES